MLHGSVERVKVMGGDRHTVSLAGMHLLGDLADRVASTAYSAAVAAAGERAPAHDRGRLLSARRRRPGRRGVSTVPSPERVAHGEQTGRGAVLHAGWT